MAPTDPKGHVPTRTECRDCIYWVGYVHNNRSSDIGNCHRYPPFWDGVAFGWPSTAPHEFCGEALREGGMIQIIVSCSMCHKSRDLVFYTTSLDREFIQKKIQSHGWIIQQNGAITDVYCSKKCAL